MKTLTDEQLKELKELIHKVHESTEGRYNLDGDELHSIHAYLCDLEYIETDKHD